MLSVLSKKEFAHFWPYNHVSRYNCFFPDKEIWLSGVKQYFLTPQSSTQATWQKKTQNHFWTNFHCIQRHFSTIYNETSPNAFRVNLFPSVTLPNSQGNFGPWLHFPSLTSGMTDIHQRPLCVVPNTLLWLKCVTEQRAVKERQSDDVSQREVS